MVICLSKKKGGGRALRSGLDCQLHKHTRKHTI